jgi:hypothetical protein
MFTYPIDTVKLTDEVFSALEKVFDGHDPIREYSFSDTNLMEDFKEYKANILCDPRTWKSESMEAMKRSINSFIVVDLPSEQTGNIPEPYSYFVNISDVHDFEMTANNKEVDWIMFYLDRGIGEGNRIAIYDDERYRIIRIKKQGEYIEEINNTHDLGYCPARQFWTESMSVQTPTLKKSPITTQLGSLDWILFYSLSKKYADLYSPWTIYWGYMRDCDYDKPESQYRCDNGYLKSYDNNYIFSVAGRIEKCPRCAERINGVGSFVEVPAPEKDVPPMAPPVGKVDVDVAALEYNVEELSRLQSEFYSSVTGSNFETISNQAVNEKQVMSLYESRKQVLINLKSNFESAESWRDSTICRLRYGNKFKSLSYSYGTDFYLGDADQFLEMYKNCRDNGLDHPILDMLQNQHYQTRYKNNPQELNKVKIITDLDPFRHATRAEIKDLKNEIDYREFMLKMNFSTYLRRFEREQGSILEFGSNREYREKIAIIKDVLLSYIIISEQQNLQQDELQS